MASRQHWRLTLMPDVGDVLGDGSLAEPFEHAFVGRAKEILGLGEEEEKEDELGSNVFYYIVDEEPFFSLSPPPSHLWLRMNYLIHEESLQHWLSSPSLSFLALDIGETMDDQKVSRACNLLRKLPRDCHLRCLALLIHNYELSMEMESNMEMEQKISKLLVDAFVESPACKLHSLILSCEAVPAFLLNPEYNYASMLHRKCCSLFFDFGNLSAAEQANILSSFMPITDHDSCVLRQLALVSSGITILYDIFQSNGLFRLDDGHAVGVLENIARCKLTRLDIRSWPALGPQGMSLLVASLASPGCCIRDLGISLSSTPHFNQTRLLILAQAFQCGSSLHRLQVLRFARVDSHEAATCVLQILTSPPSNCKVRFLHLQIRQQYDTDDYEPFFKKLLTIATPPRIECLRVFFYDRMSNSNIESELEYLSDFLGQEHCPLLWLQCLLLNTNIPESLQMKVVNSLESNFVLNFLHIDYLDSPAAKSRASTFLNRNRLYKAMGLSKEDLMRPQMARLFLCGHGEVGKTTLRKALLKLHQQKHPYSLSSPRTDLSEAASQYIGGSCNMCFQPCRQSSQANIEPRTRGLEIHQLCFEATQKLVIFDLGGQPDYHIFHHYFMTNTSHDLFILVGKYTPKSTQASQLQFELEYWLKFIVSHRNSVQGPNPKIMLVINFFGATQEMQEQALFYTEDLRRKYAQQLDFGAPPHQHVFGIVAIHAKQSSPIMETLKKLLVDLLNQRPVIPKLCNDLLSVTLPLLAEEKSQNACSFAWGPHGTPRGGKRAFRKWIVDFEEVKEQCVQQQDQVHQITEGDEVSKLERRIQAALRELHNVGEVVYFPLVVDVSKKGKMSEGSEVDNATSSLKRDQGRTSPIIVDPNWFYNKVIGNLLAPKSLSGKSQWTKDEIKHVLVDSGCSVRYIDEVLRYILNLDLCFALGNNLFFPAVASEKKLHWPPNFRVSRKSGNNTMSTMHFYGRRIKCKDSESHLIPSGVFARLQVKLQNLFGIQGYKWGYHWVSFVKNRVSVMVRFGKVNVSDQKQLHTLPMHMEADYHPVWIDILLCCPSSAPDSQQQEGWTSAEDGMMQQIKKLIFDICQATYRGIPTVVLEECALRDEAREDARQLIEIEECIKGESGLESDVVWEDQESTPVVDLLLPGELQHHVVSHVQAIQQIQGEFPYSSTKQQADGEGGDQLLYPQLQGEFKVLYDLINSKLDRNFESLGAKMDNVLDVVKEIKRDVRKVMQGLRQVEANIVAKCSTGLLEELLLHHQLPAYPYLTTTDGKMQRLRKFFGGRKATVHFLCESHTDQGPHKVEGQVGREVEVDESILRKWAPFLIPSLMVVCCAASLAVNAYLGGVSLPFVAPFLDFLNSIGITQQHMKSQILPNAAKALFEDVDVKIPGLYDCKAGFINIDKEQRAEGVQAVQKVLGSIHDLDMNEDFGLCLVQVGERVQWLCKKHAGLHPELKHPCNPFSDLAKKE